MGLQIITENGLARPVPDPLTSSVLSHADVTDKRDGFNLRNEAGMWQSFNCLDTLALTDICPEGEPTAKDFDAGEWQSGFSFAVYGAVQCRTVGTDEADLKSEVARVFGLNEGKGVERALLRERFVAKAATATSPTEWDAPVDLTPGTAIPLPVAFALLEGYAARIYSGVPTIHMSRSAASLLGADKVVWNGDKAFSRLGSKIAIGGGYDPDASDITGAWTMYATGDVVVERGEEVQVSVHKIPGDGAPQPDNTFMALAERAYRVAVDCFTAKATGTVWTV